MIRFAAILCIALAMLFGAEGLNAATFTVTKTADTNDGTCDADCSLREAVAAANAAVGDDVVRFALPLFSTPQTITLSGTEIVVTSNGSLTIYGTGANRLTISGNNASRILATGANVIVFIHDLKFTGGNGVGATNSGRGGAIYNVGGTMVIMNSILTGNSAANGGAMNAAASASPSVPANTTLINCVLSNNSSTSSGAALQNFSTSTLELRNTTVNNNTSSGTGIAGAFQANGTVVITNSTFSGNNAPAGTGGGVYFNGSNLIMTNTTLVGNSSLNGGGGLHRTATTPVANVRNTIIAGNTGAAATPDVSGTITSQGNNIIGNIGTSVGWLMSDLQNTNPLVSPLGFHGGIGMTHALLSGSPALNGGQNCVTDASCSAANPPVGIKTDARGAARTGNVDIGAFEENSNYSATLPSALVDQPYNQTLAPNVGAFTYSVASGSPPPGITVNTGAVAATVGGTPTALGAYSFGVSITSAPNSATVNYVLHVLSDLSIVPVTGRVTLFDGSPLRNANVVLTDLAGNSRFALTNGFGYFHFADVQAGGTYTLSVSSKEHEFPTRIVTITDATSSLDVAEIIMARAK